MTDSHATHVWESATNQSPGRAAIFGLGLVVLAIVLIVWKSSLDGSFQFDDYGNIVNKQGIDQLWPPTMYLQSGRPLGLYSLAVNKRFSADSPYGFHLFNLAVHAANAMLIYAGILLSRLVWLQRRRDASGLSTFWVAIAALAALLWSIHPLTTQAVTYIVQRYESLSAMGYLGAWVGLLLVLGGSGRWQRLAGYLMILLFAWVGLTSKEVFATAPLSVLLFDRQLTRQTFAAIFARRWLAYGLLSSPFCWFVLSVSRWFDTSRSSSMGLGMEEVNSWEYLRTQPEVILHYLRLAVWPYPQSLDYVWRIQQRPEIYFSLGAIIVSLLLLGFWWYVRGLRPVPRLGHAAADAEHDGLPVDASIVCGWYGWGILTFFFILAPTSSFMPIADLAFEHRMYLPLALVVAGIVFAGGMLLQRLWGNSRNPLVLGAGAAMIVVAAGGLLGWRTHVRNLDYRDELTLWMRVTEVAPENPRGWYHVGSALYKRGHRDAALPCMISAVGFGGSQNPMYDVGLADCLRHAGRVDEALFFYRRAIENKPEFAEGHNNLGVVYLERDEDEMALNHFTIASQLGHAEAMHNLAMLYERREHHAQAIEWLQKAIDTATAADQPTLIERIQSRLQANQRALSTDEPEEGQP
ncbi:tetratricopeptide repeat protein [Roseimaritima ulvae]|uniref:Tetratricopeptide repeat protein n=1 Tax=Roseimaritima ulvae TaxID=980254 RepID=A0A5B9QPB1_9BACT|nr:tetratricopeptide repeat protein [Roseimaritima ulvae]QEG40858.1 Tetratricopeptide repeat protein [Roseimaritima ulvae]